MNSLQIETEIESPRFFYDASSVGGKLERYLISKKIDGIGTQERGDAIRNAGRITDEPFMSEIGKEERAYRSLIIQSMTQDQIQNLHEYERKYATRFLITTGEMEKLIHVSINLKRKISKNLIDYVIEWNKKRIPELKKFQGFTVSQYFIYDFEFCPMTFHHAWDRNVFYAEKINFIDVNDKSNKEYRDLM